MEDFGYSKQQEESGATSVIKRAFLIGATLFSVACFIYVTINAYYFFSQEGSGGNVETIKAEADPIKVVEGVQDAQNDSMKIDNSIYEDIFGNRKHAKEKEVKLRESISPALPPKTSQTAQENVKTAGAGVSGGATGGKTNSITANATNAQNQNNQSTANQNKNGKIIVYSDAPAEADNKILLDKAKPATRQQTAQSNPSELAKIAAKPALAAKRVRVQIAALTSRKSADEYWDRLQHLYPQLFSGLKSYIEEVDLGKRGIFYRLQIGSFFDQVRAEEFCNKYVSQTQKNRADCIVVE